MNSMQAISRWRRAGLLACSLAWALGAANAQSAGNAGDMTGVVQQWLDHSLAQAKDGAFGGLRPEVELGQIDSRLRLAPCQQIEPYMPPGARLWGRTRVGLRCTEGPSRWNVTVPVTVRAWGAAWALKRDVPSGAPILDADLMQIEADWAAEMSPVLAKEGSWSGQVASRHLPAGHVLRQASVKPIAVFQSGTQVRVVAVGRGFSVTADGQAMTAGALGQLARVRMDNGRVLSGTVVDANTVRVDI